MVLKIYLLLNSIEGFYVRYIFILKLIGYNWLVLNIFFVCFFLIEVSFFVCGVDCL